MAQGVESPGRPVLLLAVPGFLIGQEMSQCVGTKSRVEPPPRSILRKFSCQSVKLGVGSVGGRRGTSAFLILTFLLLLA